MEIKDLHFSYGQTPFLEDLNFQLEKGKITTILGPNGSGKSTLLNLLVKQYCPNAGEVLLDGKALATMKNREVARKLSVVHQHNRAPGDLSVEELVGYGRVPHQSFWAGKTESDQTCIEWAMQATHVTAMRGKALAELSGGECQRAWIAMALAQKTEYLFLDEPTTYLDISYQMEILNLVQTLNRQYGITIIMVLHDINQALQYSDNLLIMKAGTIRYNGSAENGITEEVLRDIYGIEALIRECPENHCRYVIPIQIKKEHIG